MEVQYCPTENVWTDILNNPDQRMKFHKDRAALMYLCIKVMKLKERKLIRCFYPERSKMNIEIMIAC